MKPCYFDQNSNYVQKLKESVIKQIKIFDCSEYKDVEHFINCMNNSFKLKSIDVELKQEYESLFDDLFCEDTKTETKFVIEPIGKCGTIKLAVYTLLTANKISQNKFPG